MSHGEAINEEERGSRTAVCSGPGDEQGWEAGGPPPEPDVRGRKQLPCTSYEKMMWSSRARAMKEGTYRRCIHGRQSGCETVRQYVCMLVYLHGSTTARRSFSMMV